MSCYQSFYRVQTLFRCETLQCQVSIEVRGRRFFFLKRDDNRNGQLVNFCASSTICNLFSVFHTFDLSPRENGGKFCDNAQEEKHIEMKAMKTGGDIYEFEFSQIILINKSQRSAKTMPGIL